MDCTDRQLNTSVVNYTSQHFSQVLIQAELAHVKSAKSLDELTDEHMTIRVASTVNEVTARYLVDEHQLEMTLKMPLDWPLHPIEIKDWKMVGVVENRWRAWVMGVQQTIGIHVSFSASISRSVEHMPGMFFFSPPKTEWPCCGWAEFVQEERESTFRGASGMSDLLFVSFFFFFLNTA